MAFTPVDIPIQEMLASDFMTDLSQIHNTNVLLLKDKLEDLLNNFEIDTTSISIGTDNPINSIKTTDLIIQDGGFVFQTGTPNQIIAKLSKNSTDQSVLNVDILSVDINMSIAEASIETLLVSGESEVDNITVDGVLNYNSSIIESKERITVDIDRNTLVPAKAGGTITLTNTSKRNIYVTLNLNQDVGSEQVFNGTSILTGIENIIATIDFDSSNPPAENQSFTIFIEDIITTTNGSVIGGGSFDGSVEPLVSIAAGVNQSTSETIILHHDLATQDQTLSINTTVTGILPLMGNSTFNYIIDSSDNDRLIITSKEYFSILG